MGEDEVDDETDFIDDDAESEYDEIEDEDSELFEEEYENEMAENEDYYDDNENIDDYDLEKEEADALIADTFFGLEVYSIAFGVLCCLCVCCWAQKTKCCGLLSTGKESEHRFEYAAYHSQGGFKKVFGNVEEEDLENDVEMGVDQEEIEYINCNQ